MTERTSPSLTVSSVLLGDGFRTSVATSARKEVIPLRVRYPRKIWQAMPASLRREIAENLSYAGTHFIPLMMKVSELRYRFPCPSLESYWFQNTLKDLPACELADGVLPESYLKAFFNLTPSFAPSRQETSFIPQLPGKRMQNPSTRPHRVAIPFTFGKESMLTFGLAKTFGLSPVLMYVEEPSHPFERAWKRRELLRLGRQHEVDTVFVSNTLGSLRYGKALGLKEETEIGWGSQTTQLALLSLPLVFSHGVSSILIGNEGANNEAVQYGGVRAALSFDQSAVWTPQQSAMTRALTGGYCSVFSSLEPIEEMAIFYMLHRYYPELGKLQFSCSAQRPLVCGSQWCHECYKCDRMFIFARCCDVDPFAIGFKRDLLAEPNHFEHYFGTKFASGSGAELDFSFLTLERKGLLGVYKKVFMQCKKKLQPWAKMLPSFTTLQEERNLAPFIRPQLLRFFKKGLKEFEEALTANDGR